MIKKALILAWLFSAPATAQTVPPPSQAAAAGFNTLVYQDKFHPLDWPTQFVWEPPPTGTFIPVSGELTITKDSGTRQAMIADHPLNTQPATGYLFGYFEGRLRFRSPADVTNSWGAFFMWSNTGFEQSPPKTYCEFDAIEAWGHNILNITAHIISISSSGVGNDQVLNKPTQKRMSFDILDGHWHTFGFLWQPGQLSWYVDDNFIETSPSNPTCDTLPMNMLIWAGSHTADIQTTDVAWVRVWQ